MICSKFLFILFRFMLSPWYRIFVMLSFNFISVETPFHLLQDNNFYYFLHFWDYISYRETLRKQKTSKSPKPPKPDVSIDIGLWVSRFCLDNAHAQFHFSLLQSLLKGRLCILQWRILDKALKLLVKSFNDLSWTWCFTNSQAEGPEHLVAFWLLFDQRTSENQAFWPMVTIK